VKTITQTQADHLAAPVTTFCTCVRITRGDGVVLAFTDHDQDLSIAGVTYLAAQGFDATPIQSSGNLAVDNLEVIGRLDDVRITERDLLTGVYDAAEVEFLLADYARAEAVTVLRYGTVGEITLGPTGQFTVEIRGLTQRLNTALGELYGPTCRALLGDSRCGVSLAAHTFTGTITAVSEERILSVSGCAAADGSLNGGVLTLTSGLLAGRSMEIKAWATPTLHLFLPMPYGMAAGDTFSAVRGCDKTLATCRDTFANVVNFRGEPYIPGTDKTLIPIIRR
jgi:uncharacterized phage protein (TIGR02218 family)